MTIKAQTGLSKRRMGRRVNGPLVTSREYQQERHVTSDKCLPTDEALGGGRTHGFFTPL